MVQQQAMDLRPYSRGGPVPQSSPTTHAGTTAKLLRQQSPANSTDEHKENASQRLPLSDRFTSRKAKPPRLHRRQLEFNQRPQCIIENRSGHGVPPCTPRYYQTKPYLENVILLDALSSILSKAYVNQPFAFGNTSAVTLG